MGGKRGLQVERVLSRAQQVTDAEGESLPDTSRTSQDVRLESAKWPQFAWRRGQQPLAQRPAADVLQGSRSCWLFRLTVLARGDVVDLMTSQPRWAIAAMAAMNKCLARNNKSRIDQEAIISSDFQAGSEPLSLT